MRMTMTMRTMRVLALAAAMTLGAAVPAAAQATPEETVMAFFETFRTGDYAANAAMMDPAALEQLKATMVGFASLPGAEGDETFGRMFGVKTAEEMRALPAAELYARMLRGTLGADEVREMMSLLQARPLGHVMEGDTAHVVYRMKMSMNGADVEQVQVAPMVRVDGTWKLLLTGTLAGLMPSLPAEAP